MHIDWFVVLVAAISIPLAVWGCWLAVKDEGEKRSNAGPHATSDTSRG
jgi:hypothetical protein